MASASGYNRRKVITSHEGPAMTVFFVRFKAKNPKTDKAYFGNFALPYETLDEALEALSQREHIAATRLYIQKNADGMMAVVSQEKRSLSMSSIDIIAVSRMEILFP